MYYKIFESRDEFNGIANREMNGFSQEFIDEIGIDKFNSMVTNDKYSGNKGCWNCINCIGCIDCTDCTDCRSCVNCDSCVNCEECFTSKNCLDSRAAFCTERPAIKSKEQLAKEIWVDTNKTISKCLDLKKSLDILVKKSKGNSSLAKGATTLSEYVDNILSDLDVISIFSNMVGNKGNNTDGSINWEQRRYDLYVKYLERYSPKDAIRRADVNIRIYKNVYDLI